MQAEAERHVPVRLVAPGVEELGVVEDRLVPVGHRQHRHDALAGLDLPAADDGVLQREPRETGPDDGAVPEQFLDEVGRQARVLAQGVQVLGVLQQGQRRHPDHVRGGLVARHQQQHGHAQEFLLLELPGDHALGHQSAEQVLAGVGPLVRDQVAQQAVQGLHGGADLGRTGVPVHDRAAVVLEEVVVRVGHAEQVADRHRRHRQRELVHQVGRRADLAHAAEGLVDGLLDQRLDPPDVLDHELGGQHAPEAAVGVAVHEDEQPGRALARRRDRVEDREPGAVLVGAEARVAQQLPHVLVLGDQPGPAAEGESDSAGRLVEVLQVVISDRNERVVVRPDERERRKGGHINACYFPHFYPRGWSLTLSHHPNRSSSDGSSIVIHLTCPWRLTRGKPSIRRRRGSGKRSEVFRS